MKKTAIIAWGMTGIFSILLIFQAIQQVTSPNLGQDILARLNGLIFIFVIPSFAIVAALIISRQPRNVIGWLLYLPAIPAVINVEPYIRSFSTLPQDPPLRLQPSLPRGGASALS